MYKTNERQREGNLTFEVYAREKRRHLKDADLISRTLAGEDMSYEVLMGRYVPLVLRYLGARLEVAVDIEDLTQDVFLAAYTHLGSLRDRDRFGPWVLRIARNALADYHRRAARRPMVAVPLTQAGIGVTPERFSDPAPNPRDVASERQAWQVVLDAVGEMSEANRTVLLARLIGDESAMEIAERLGLKTKTVRKRLVRAMRQLRKAIERKGIGLTSRGDNL